MPQDCRDDQNGSGNGVVPSGSIMDNFSPCNGHSLSHCWFIIKRDMYLREILKGALALLKVLPVPVQMS